MSEQNLEVVRAVFEAFEAGLDSGGTVESFDLGSNFADDAEWIPDPGGPGMRGTYRGRDGFLESMRTWTEAWEGWSLRLERLIDAGDDRVVALVHQSATGKGSGVPVEQRSGMVFELEDGRVIRMRNYVDPTHALEAAGVSE